MGFGREKLVDDGDVPEQGEVAVDEEEDRCPGVPAHGPEAVEFELEGEQVIVIEDSCVRVEH